MVEARDRRYLQARLLEETERARRYGREFSLIVLEAVPASDGLPVRRKVRLALDAIAPQLRTSDVLAQVFEDTVGVLLVETDERGAADAMLRIRNRIVAPMGKWHVSLLSYPASAEAIERHPLLNVA